MKKHPYDGFFFLPGDDGGEIDISFFNFDGEFANSEPVGSTTVGDMYHVAFFHRKDGKVSLDGTFEAIFSDPMVYLRNLFHLNMFGCIVRKTAKSSKWWEKFLTKTDDLIKIYEGIPVKE